MPEEQRHRIDELTAAHGVTLAEVIRRALDRCLAQEQPDPSEALAATSEPIPRTAFRVATSGTGADVLVDTDIFVDHLRGAVELKHGQHRLHYSVINPAELFARNAVIAALR